MREVIESVRDSIFNGSGSVWTRVGFADGMGLYWIPLVEILSFETVICAVL